MSTDINRTSMFLYPNEYGQWRIYVFLVSSNNPKKVHAINEMSPITKEMIAKINFPKKRTAISVVMKIKEKIK